MTDWHTAPCLRQLLREFDAVAPGRDKGADGTIGNLLHQKERSDHNPDVHGIVHALDIDSTGPWADRLSLDDYVQHIRAQQIAAKSKCRLQNIIWRGRICSFSWGWGWRPYIGLSMHYDHAHFSCRYGTEQERDESPYGLSTLGHTGKDDDVDELITITDSVARRLDLAPGTQLKLSILIQHTLIKAADAKTSTDELISLLKAQGAKPAK